MSKIRKARKRKQKRTIALIVLAVIALVIGFASYVVYAVFFKKPPVESFFPQDPLFYTRIQLVPRPGQLRAFNDLQQKFEDPDIFVTYAVNFVFGDLSEDQVQITKDDVVGWIGRDGAVATIPISATEAEPVIAANVRNQEKLEEFLEKLNENMRLKGNAISASTFREKEITSVRGNNELSYVVFDEYLLVSRTESGVKKMIDIRLGSEDHLGEDKAFKRTERILGGNRKMVFSYFDLLSLTSTTLEALEVTEADFLERVGYGGRLNTGMVLTAESEGVAIEMFVDERSSKDRSEVIKPKLFEKVPRNVVGYVEGHDYRDAIVRLLVGQELTVEDAQARAEALKRALELEYGFNVERDLFELVDDHYAMALLRGEDDQLDFAIMYQIESEKQATENMLKLEDIVLKALRDFKPEDFEEDRKFTDNSVNDVSYRRLNLVDSYPFDVHYFVKDEILYLATTEDAVRLLTDEELSKDSLADDSVYEDNFSNISSSNTEQVIYLEPQALFKLVENFTDFKYTFLQKEVRLLESVGFKQYRHKDGIKLEGFVKIKG